MTTNPNQPQIDKFWQLLDAGENIFLTGGGGTGKSYLMLQLIAQRAKDVAVTASTGIAAQNIDGMTVFSWSGMGLGPAAGESFPAYFAKLTRNYNARMARAVERAGKAILIIDEISMLNGRILDYLEFHLRQLRSSDRPFGGMQLVVVGDFMQLPPVTRHGQKVDWAFEADSWKNGNFHMVNLQHVIRQADADFAELLNRVRYGACNLSDIVTLQNRNITNTSELEDSVTRIFTVNDRVHNWNEQQLEALPSKRHVFHMTTYGLDTQVAALIKNVLAPEILKLKLGAKVMCVVNNATEGYFNGSVGFVEDIGTDCVTVRLETGAEVEIGMHTWHSDPEDPKSASVTQIPLRLAWAITAHKSQGATLERVHADLSNCFEMGQAYVALSRCTSLEGLTLEGFKPTSIKASPQAADFYRRNS